MSVRAVVLRAIATVTLSSLAVAAAAVPAAAAVSLSDDFEHPSSSWTFERSGLGGGHLSTAPGFAHSGTGFASVAAQTGFSSIRRDLIPGSTIRSCTVSVWLDPAGLPDDGSAARINIEAINPATWTYWTLTAVSYRTNGYRHVTSGAFRPTPATAFVFRVSVIAPAQGAGVLVDVDDFSVTCTT
jgi:hypothetical protein